MRLYKRETVNIFSCAMRTTNKTRSHIQIQAPSPSKQSDP